MWLEISPMLDDVAVLWTFHIYQTTCELWREKLEKQILDK